MQAGDWATWVGSAAATVAAVASVAVWWRSQDSVRWEIQVADIGRSPVRNVGAATARDVHVRVGSASDETDVDEEERVPSVAHGEVVRILVAPNYGSAKDYAVVVTWRGRFGRRERWTYLVH